MRTWTNSEGVHIHVDDLSRVLVRITQNLEQAQVAGVSNPEYTRGFCGGLQTLAQVLRMCETEALRNAVNQSMTHRSPLQSLLESLGG